MNGSTEKPTSIDAALRANQIIVLAFILGVTSFMGVTAFLIFSGHGPKPGMDARVLLSVLVALLFVTTIVGVVIRAAMVSGIRRQADQGKVLDAAALAPRFATLTLARAALAEGSAIFGIVTTLISGNWLGLAGGAAGIVLLALLFPTRAKFETFVRDATGQMM